MTGSIENSSPAYIASHSADVILSDIRPIKLRSEPLRAINVLLDELLYTILSAARSLTTEKLKAGLLQVLPTSLGKEALLEAEVELRAYWDRTPTPASTESDLGKPFNLSWAFELLRLKCEGYSTLNESDEDANAEARLNERFSKAGGTPPNGALLVPAALYLTAILESLCEHILTNVGRVAARDSSRTSATIQDLFTALCEDHSIYTLFRSMKVHEQIETLSKTSKPSRNRSFNRGTASAPRSPSHELVSSISRTSERSIPAAAPNKPNVTTPRSSMDKSRAKASNAPRSSHERDRSYKGQPEDTHKKSDSILSVDTRRTLAAFDDEFDRFEYGGANMQQEFDNLMRSDSTLKVSLTPDRLKTMEVYNKEKLRGSAKAGSPNVRNALSNGISSPAPLASKASLERATNGTRSHIRRVESIIEDDDEGTKATASAGRHNQGVTQAPVVPTRSRSHSASGSISFGSNLLRISSRKEVPPLPSPPTNDLDLRSVDPIATRTRRVVRNRESMDLDEVMAGSDEEGPEDPTPAEQTSKSTGAVGVSSATRDLMDFLADGPPEPPVAYSLPPEPVKAKSPGRLQKMISRLTIGDRQSRASISAVESRVSSPINLSHSSASLPWKRSQTSLPIPAYPVPPRPRPQQPISPPSSPSQASADGQTQNSPTVPLRGISTNAWEVVTSVSGPPGLGTGIPLPSRLSNGHTKLDSQWDRESSKIDSPASQAPPSVVVPAQDRSSEQSTISGAPRCKECFTSTEPSRRVTVPSDPKPLFPADDARHIRRLMSKATTADECRLLLDLFLAKSGLPLVELDINVDNPYPSPSVSIPPNDKHPYSSNTDLENTIVGLLLDGAGDTEDIPPQRPIELTTGEQSSTPDVAHASRTDDDATGTTLDNGSLPGANVETIVYPVQVIITA